MRHRLLAVDACGRAPRRGRDPRRWAVITRRYSAGRAKRRAVVEVDLQGRAAPWRSAQLQSARAGPGRAHSPSLERAGLLGQHHRHAVAHRIGQPRGAADQLAARRGRTSSGALGHRTDQHLQQARIDLGRGSEAVSVMASVLLQRTAARRRRPHGPAASISIRAIRASRRSAKVRGLQQRLLLRRRRTAGPWPGC